MLPQSQNSPIGYRQRSVSTISGEIASTMIKPPARGTAPSCSLRPLGLSTQPIRSTSAITNRDKPSAVRNASKVSANGLSVVNTGILCSPGVTSIELATIDGSTFSADYRTWRGTTTKLVTRTVIRLPYGVSLARCTSLSPTNGRPFRLAPSEPPNLTDRGDDHPNAQATTVPSALQYIFCCKRVPPHEKRTHLKV